MCLHSCSCFHLCFHFCGANRHFCDYFVLFHSLFLFRFYDFVSIHSCHPIRVSHSFYLTICNLAIHSIRILFRKTLQIYNTNGRFARTAVIKMQKENDNCHYSNQFLYIHNAQTPSLSAYLREGIERINIYMTHGTCGLFIGIFQPSKVLQRSTYSIVQMLLTHH